MQSVVLAACCFLPLVLGIIHNMERQEEDELVQPLAVDISPDDDPQQHSGACAGAGFLLQVSVPVFKRPEGNHRHNIIPFVKKLLV